MIVRASLTAALLVAAAACGVSPAASPQTATVTAGDRDCEVNPAALKVGDVTFNVHNVTTKAVAFSVKEDDDTEVVAQANVEPGSMQSVTVHLDGADEYQVHCGDVTGPEIKPQS